MLYLLFGKDNIGKKYVRDHFADTYGLIIIPKYTDDKRKKWQVYYSMDHITYKEFEEPIELDRIKEVQRKLWDKFPQNSVDIQICDAKDRFLKYLFPDEVTTGQDFEYEITKVYQHNTYRVKYFIKKSHITAALKDPQKSYMLVCTSGKLIGEIEEQAKKVCQETNQIYKPNDNPVLKLIFVDGEEKTAQTDRSSKWETENYSNQSEKSPGEYFFNNSYKFYRITNKKIERGSVDDINKMLDRQWSSIQGTSPIKTKKHVRAFIVRGFSPNPQESTMRCEDIGFNVNEVFESELKQRVNSIIGQENVDWLRLDDEKYRDKEIVARIIDAIDDSDIVFIDLRNHRPNCYFEYGYAKAISSFLKHEVIVMVGTATQEYDPNLYKTMIDELDSALGLKTAMDGVAFDTNHFFYYTYILSNPNRTRNGIKMALDIQSPPSSTYDSFDECINRYKRASDIDKYELWRE